MNDLRLRLSVKAMADQRAVCRLLISICPRGKELLAYLNKRVKSATNSAKHYERILNQKDIPVSERHFSYRSKQRWIRRLLALQGLLENKPDQPAKPEKPDHAQ